MSSSEATAWELGDHCEGLHFRYYREDKNGRYRSIPANQRFRNAEEFILTRIRDMLKGRPDLMRKLACFPGGVEVRLYEGGELTDIAEGSQFVARATDAGDHLMMEFAIGEIEYAQQNTDGLDVVVHEIAHVLNFFTREEGMLPGLTTAQKNRYREARRIEQERLRKGKSILHSYAITNDIEFLAVLAETFFRHPSQLRDSNPALFEIMRDYFKLE